jgi:hypothetical protein
LSSTTGSEPYRQCVIAVGTRHGKHHQLAPAFAEILGAHLIAPRDVDTDQFGTFTGEITRSIPALAAARAKARLAITISGLPFGLASEASYGSVPNAGWCGHEELLVFIDDNRGIEIVEGYRTSMMPGLTRRATSFAELASLGDGWPAQALIVRPAVGGAASDIVKGITDAEQLRCTIAAAAQLSADGYAVVEPDLRAHHNPTRQAVLTRLAGTLAYRLATSCPSCGTPGYGRGDTQPGLPCRICRTPTDLVFADLHECQTCTHRSTHPRPEPAADPSCCPNCNR